MSNPFEGRDTFENEAFEGLNLEHADLSNRSFDRCTFRNSKLGESRWHRSRLDDCTFEGCDLVRIDVKMLALRGARFTSCRLMGVDFADIAKFPDMSFHECNLHYASFATLALRKAVFEKCSFVEANFFETDLAEAKLDDCQFTDARFEACDLRKARFKNAQNLFIDPAKNRVAGAKVPLETAVLLATSFGMRVLDVQSDRE
jgi:fluoroquinolone resistance protein